MKYNGMNLATDVPDVSAEWAFTAHFHVDGAKATASGTASVLALTALAAAAQTVTANIINPSVPRNVQVIGNAAGIAGDVTIKGTAYDGKDISETLTLNGTTAVVGTKAFAKVTEIDLPAFTNADTDEVSVGVGDALGLPYKIEFGDVLSAWLNKAKEGTAPTLTTDSANIESNTITLNSALNGDDVDVFLVV